MLRGVGQGGSRAARRGEEDMTMVEVKEGDWGVQLLQTVQRMEARMDRVEGWMERFAFELVQTRTELRSEMQQLDRGLRSEMQQVRTEMNHLGTELRSEMEQLSTELRSEMGQLGTELLGDAAPWHGAALGDAAPPCRGP